MCAGVIAVVAVGKPLTDNYFYYFFYFYHTHVFLLPPKEANCKPLTDIATSRDIFLFSYDYIFTRAPHKKSIDPLC